MPASATAKMLSAIVFLSLTAGAGAQTAYPSQRITLIVPTQAGGASDVVARILSQHLGKSLGQNVIVDNRGGASGNAGALAVVRAAPDGYTLLLAATNNIVINQHLMKSIGHDPLTELAPVALVAEAPELVSISASFPAKTMKEFIDAVRQKPGTYNYSTPGAGTVPHLSVERLLRATGTKMVHVPFRGGAAMMTEVASGNVQMAIGSLASIEPFRQAGNVRLLAISAPKRLGQLPDVPTLEETGWKNLEMSNWWAVMAPKGTPANVIALLNARLREAFASADATAQLEKLGIVTRSETVEYFEKFIQKEATAWEAVVKDLGLQPQ